jgi:OOP family OmpA-OmpF porin
MRVSYSVFLLTCALVTTPALAQQSKQTSENIIEFFGNAVDLGKTRGICVGTEEECKAKAEAAAPIDTGLDMLINFDLDSSDLTPDARAKLAEFAKALQDTRLKSHSFLVEGYTDASGAATYNDALSQRRAQSVTAFLLANGIEASRVTAIGKGETNPRVTDPYDPVNRRVEMRINLQ